MKTKDLAKIAVLAALSIVLVAIIHIPILPAVSFLEYDPADIPILLCTFAMGPWAGLILTAIVALIQGLTVSAASGWYGIVMHFVATGVFVLVAGFVYNKNKTKKNAIIALAIGTISMTLIMIPSNLFLTPIYLQIFGMTAEAGGIMVRELMPWIVLFNIIKASLNSILTFLIYKRVSGILHK